MTLDLSGEARQALWSNLPCMSTKVGALRWHQEAEQLQAAGARLLTMWGADDRDRDGRFRIYAACLVKEGVVVFEHEMDQGAKPTYPSLAEIFPCAVHMERSVHDLF